MIDLLRLDERLIHGQIAAAWVKTLPVDTLLVIDDTSATDPFLTKTLYMASQANIKTFVMTNEEALKVLNDPRCADRHIFVVVRTIDTLLNIAENAKDVKEVNVSNYGRLVTSGKERKGYTDHLFLDDDEAVSLKKVLAFDIPAFMQMTPSQPKTPLTNILKNV